MNPYYEQMKASVVGNGVDSNDEDIGRVYKSVMYQRGYGLNKRVDYNVKYGLGFADMMQGFFRVVSPLLKTGLQYLGNQAVNSAANIAKDVIAGRNVKEAAKDELSNASEEIFAKAPAAVARVIKAGERKRKAVSSPDPIAASTSRRKRARYFRGRGLLKTYPALNKILQ